MSESFLACSSASLEMRRCEDPKSLLLPMKSSSQTAESTDDCQSREGVFPPLIRERPATFAE